MPHFGMHQAVCQLLPYDHTASDARTDREIDVVMNVSRSAPMPFGKRGGIHISIKANGQV
jgi:hypothetical protein